MKKYLLPFLSLAGYLASSNPARCNPDGGVVVSGSGTITGTGSGNVTINQNTDKIIIDWNNFSIGAGEITKFIQPGSSAAALNRVTGGNLTSIYGMLQGNGEIYVINPAGIMIGPGGVINTHSFAGSTLDVANSSFLSGVGMKFSGDSTAGIKNMGTINALGGDVFLFAHTVENTGSITAANGTVGMAAGSEIMLQDGAGDRVSVIAGNIKVPQAAVGVNNAGAVQAANAELQAAGGNIYALAINNGGIIRATTVVNQGGHILLRAAGGSVQNTGILDASSTTGKGGNVEVLGSSVKLASGSLIDASGATGGGTVKVGGGAHGTDASVINATTTVVEQGAEIHANAVSSGDGGEVTVWADDTTLFYGKVFAQAQGATGNGGNAEVSGAMHLAYGGNAYLQSAHAVTGTLLLDPGAIGILHAGAAGINGTDFLDDAVLANALDTANVSISTAASPPNGPNNANPHILTMAGTADAGGAASIVWSSGFSLILNGEAGVNLHQGSILNSSGTGKLTITSAGDITLAGGISVANNLQVTSTGGSISDGSSGVFTIGGTTTLAAGAGKTISLTQGNDFTGAVSVTGGQNVTLNDINGIDLGPINISGGLNVTAAGAITDSGAVVVGGTTTLAAGSANNITLDNADDFGTVKVTSAKDVTLNDINALDLGASTITGKLNTTTGGALTQSGLVSVGGASTFTVTAANSDISLNGFANVFTGGVTLASTGLGTIKNVLLRDAAATPTLTGLPSTLNNLSLTYDNGGINLAASTVTGTLTVKAFGDIGETGIQNVTGASSFTVTKAGANINLGGFANVFTGGVTLAATGLGTFNDISLRDAAAAPALAGLPATVNNLSLTYDNGGISLGAVAVVGALNVTAAGNINETGILNVTGLSTLTVTKAASNVGLGGFANVFTGGVKLATTGVGTFNDVAIRDASVAPTITGLPSTLHNLSLTFDAGGIALAGGTITGTLGVTAFGSITETGILNVTGPSTFTVTKAASDIGLGGFANVFTGGVTLAATGAGTINDVSLRDAAAAPALAGLPSTLHNLSLTYDAGGIALAGGTITGTLGVTAFGSITETGILNVTGPSTFTVTKAASDIGLGGFANVFTGGVTLAATGAGSINNVAFRDTTATPSLAGLPATVNDLTLQYDNAGIALPTETVNGNLKVTASGAITDAGNVKVVGTTTLAAGVGNDITLDNNDDFGGAVSINSGKNVTLNDINAIALGASTVSGTLNVTAAGAISDTGAVVVNGTTTLTAGAANNITLTQADDFKNTVTVVSGKDVTLNDINAIDLGASTVSGNLKVTSAGAITDSGNLVVTGTTTLAAGAANNITLNHADDFKSSVIVTSGKDVTLNDINAITLGASTVSGNLVVTTAGAISDSGAVVVNGATSLTAGAANNITLTQADDFKNTVTVLSGKDVTLNDINTLALGASTISGKLTTTTGGSLTESGLLNVTGASSFTVTAANSDIGLAGFANIFTGGVTIGATGVGTIRNVAFEDATATPTLNGLPATVNNLTLQYDNAGIAIPIVGVNGNLSITANGPITDTGNITVNGTTTLAAGAANNITLNHADDFIGAVTVNSGKDVVLNDINALQLGASTISGKLTVTTAGNISELGSLNVTGASSFTSSLANTDIGLGGFANTFTGGATIAASGLGSIRDLSLRDTSTALLNIFPNTLRNLTLQYDNAAVTLGAITASGFIDITANGTISQTGLLNVTGTSKFTETKASSDLALGGFGNQGNLFTGGVTLATSGAGTYNNVTLRDRTLAPSLIGLPGTLNNLTLQYDNAGIALAALTANGNLSVTANGAITDAGNLKVFGTTTLSAGAANNILLTKADDFVGSVSILSGKNVTLNDINAIDLGASTISGNLVLTSAGAVTDSGNLSVTGTTTLTAGAGNNITLNHADDFVGAVSIVSGNNVTLKDVNAINLAASTVSGNLSVSSAGAITDSGAIKVNGTTTLGAGTGNNITLTQADDFSGAVSVTSANNVVLNDINTLTLGASTINGTLTTITAGNVTETGAVSVNGASTFSSSAANTDIALGGFANVFGGGVSIAATGLGSIRDVNLRDGAAAPSLVLPAALNNLTLQYDNAGIDLKALTINGNLNVTTAGGLTDSGAIKVVGTTTLAAGAANNITLDNLDDFAGAVTVTSGNNVTLNDINAINLGASTVSGNYNVTATGKISESGVLNVAGAASLVTSTLSDVDVSTQNNNFNSIAATGNNISINDVNGYSLGNIRAAGTLNLLNTAGSVQQLAGSTVEAITLIGNLGGSLTLGNPNIPFSLPQSLAQPNNKFQIIGSLTAGGSIYIFDSDTTAYNALSPNPNPNPHATDSLGLVVNGPVKANSGDITIRTAGDLELLGAAGSTTVQTVAGSIQISAENNGNFHNLLGATVSGGGWVASGTTAGSAALVAGGGRYLVFSTDRGLNFNNVINNIGQLTFNGLSAGFLADQITIAGHPTPIVKQNGTQDDGTQNGFVFVVKQTFVQPDETAKFFLDLQKLITATDVDETANVESLPPERPPTIWTSSYHIKIKEQEEKKKGKKVKRFAEDFDPSLQLVGITLANN